MENENIDVQEDVVEQEEQTSDVDTDESPEEETVTISKAKFNSIHRKAIAHDANKNRPQKIINNSSSSDTKWKERMELRVEGYDDVAVEFIQKNGGRKALENPFVVKALEAMKEQKQAEKALIDDGSKSETEKRISSKDFSKLSSDDMIKALSEQN